MRVLPQSRWGKGLGLVAIVLIGIEVVTSFKHFEATFQTFAPQRRLWVAVNRGTLFAVTFDRRRDGLRLFILERASQRALANPADRSVLDLVGQRQLYLPLWYVWMPAVVGAFVIERRHAKRSRTPHECDRCRYDLTGLPPGAVCPECGQRPDRRDGASRFGVRSVVRSRGARALAPFALVLIGLDLASGLRTFETSFELGGLHLSAGLDAGAFGVMTQPVAFVDQWGVDEDPALNRRRWWFMYFHWPIAGLGRVDGVTLPLWHLYIPLIACAIFLERRHAKRNRNSNACDTCGYDLVGLHPALFARSAASHLDRASLRNVYPAEYASAWIQHAQAEPRACSWAWRASCS